MRASEAVSRIPTGVIQAFMDRIPQSMRDRVAILQNPTDELRGELADAKEHGRGWSSVPMFAQNLRQRAGWTSSGSSGKARVEENYLYSSRRFPALGNNTIGAGGLTAGAYPFFTKGVNDDGNSMGWPTGFVLSTPETNLESGGGAIPQGTSYVMSQLAISFDGEVTKQDLAIMTDQVTLAFSKSGGQFNLSHGPLKLWPAGVGIAGFAAGANGTAAEFAPGFLLQSVTNGVPDIRAVRTLRIPRILREKETFSYGMVVARPTKSKDGSTIALSSFVVATIWLFGGQRNVIPS